MPNIYFDTEGNIKGLYSNVLADLNLGNMNIRRASNVEFNNETQKWEVDVIGEGILAKFDSRQEALDWEVQYLESKIENNGTI